MWTYKLMPSHCSLGRFCIAAPAAWKRNSFFDLLFLFFLLLFSFLIFSNFFALFYLLVLYKMSLWKTILACSLSSWMNRSWNCITRSIVLFEISLVLVCSSIILLLSRTCRSNLALSTFFTKLEFELCVGFYWTPFAVIKVTKHLFFGYPFLENLACNPEVFLIGFVVFELSDSKRPFDRFLCFSPDLKC